MTTHREILERSLESIIGKIAELDALPSEPDTEARPCVIHWDMKFNHDGICGRLFSYAAIRVGDLWYTTGPKSPKAYTWEQLAKWLVLDNHLVGSIWLAVEWEEVS